MRLSWQEHLRLLRIEGRLAHDDPAFVARVRTLSTLASEPPATMVLPPIDRLLAWFDRHIVATALMAVMILLILLIL
ncbi:unnamed protein product [[Actinomadura] parvosata subsp. kistnae]|uniref:Uncharacterized protein n=1 Tax=[Actinomadura] parvosata subsp. kistnae TaxID=1909395 RepID=A0A1U9ZZ32_9ACTN|nr:hypothetical protein [Nonomuraea sp. ATCC 55076]AQZ63204.1 hypothetical protein BKM31_18600 [Nonomuraea sp. ATCC 55076]SPL98868.1 unnamed protein product [Actinomadura parvosata subsp. kistnae]